MEAITFLPLCLIFLLQEDPSKLAAELIERLRSDKIEERDAAEQKLRDLGETALPALRKAAGDKDPEVAQRARRLVNLIPVTWRLSPNLKKVVPDAESRIASGDPGAWPELFLRLVYPGRGKGDDPEKLAGIHRDDLGPLVPMAIAHARNEEEKDRIVDAARGWWALGAPYQQVVKLLRDSNVDVRRMAAYALGERMIRETAPDLLPLAADDIETVRSAALWSLTELRHPEVVPLLIRRLKEDATEDVVRYVIKLDAKEAAPPLLECIREKDGNVRIHVLEALVELGYREAIPEFRKLLGDVNPRVRDAAITALVRLKDYEAGSQLIQLLRDPERSVRWNAISAVGRLGIREAITGLEGLLEADGGRYAHFAIESLADLGAKESAPQLTKLLQDREPSIRAEAARALGRLGFSKARPSIAALLDDSEERVRYSATRALGLLSGPAGTPEWDKLLRHKDPKVRSAAVDALEEQGTAEAAAEVMKFIKDKDASVRLNAVESLRGPWAKAVAARLTGWLKDEDEKVRRAAIESLVEIGHPALHDLLMKRLEDPEPPVRVSAASWLCRMGLRDGVPTLLKEEPYEDLLCLNALRNPELWNALSGIHLKRQRWYLDLGQIARATGLRLVWPEGRVLGYNKLILFYPRDQVTGVEALREAAYQSRHEAVLESGEIILFPFPEGRKFWQKWWKEQQKK